MVHLTLEQNLGVYFEIWSSILDKTRQNNLFSRTQSNLTLIKGERND